LIRTRIGDGCGETPLQLREVEGNRAVHEDRKRVDTRSLPSGRDWSEVEIALTWYDRHSSRQACDGRGQSIESRTRVCNARAVRIVILGPRQALLTHKLVILDGQRLTIELGRCRMNL
jgi:hypothetical protein